MIGPTRGVIDCDLITTYTRTVCFRSCINKLQICSGCYSITCPTSIKQIVVTILRTCCNTVDLLQDIIYFILIRLEHIWIVDTLVACMHSQLTCLNQSSADFIQCAFRCLHQRNCHLRIVNSLIQSCRLRTQIF